jgi:hypothetical protein
LQLAVLQCHYSYVQPQHWTLSIAVLKPSSLATIEMEAHMSP